MPLKKTITHRFHHVESSSVHHISCPFALSFALLTAAVLAREDRSLGALDREESSTSLLRFRAVADDGDDKKKISRKYHQILRCAFFVVLNPVALYRDPSSLRPRRMRGRASRESSRLLAALVSRVRSTDWPSRRARGGSRWARSNWNERRRMWPSVAEAARPTNLRMCNCERAYDLCRWTERRVATRVCSGFAYSPISSAR